MIWLSLLLSLVGCASHSSRAIAKLDDKSETFGSGRCQNARNNAWVHEDLKTAKMWAMPSVLLVVGPAATAPLFLANVGLNTADHMKASEIKASCGGEATTQQAMASDIALDAVVDMTVGAVVPAGAAISKIGSR
ncbi:MAG: hypothetical protein EBZ60_02035 [Betaproteobacteria bacterium]|nr:hypothetical protein [Betaproteobacteria bacterium]